MKEREEKFIPLSEAEKHSEYSADYLKLRARQGKLKAEKVNRRWMTTLGWLEKYEKRMDKYWDLRKKKGLTPEEAEEKIEKLKKAKERVKKLRKVDVKREDDKDIPSFPKLAPVLKRSAAAVLVSLLVVGGVWGFQKIEMQDGFGSLSSFRETLEEDFGYYLSGLEDISVGGAKRAEEVLDGGVIKGKEGVKTEWLRWRKGFVKNSLEVLYSLQSGFDDYVLGMREMFQEAEDLGGGMKRVSEKLAGSAVKTGRSMEVTHFRLNKIFEKRFFSSLVEKVSRFDRKMSGRIRRFNERLKKEIAWIVSYEARTFKGFYKYARGRLAQALRLSGKRIRISLSGLEKLLKEGASGVASVGESVQGLLSLFGGFGKNLQSDWDRYVQGLKNLVSGKDRVPEKIIYITPARNGDDYKRELEGLNKRIEELAQKKFEERVITKEVKVSEVTRVNQIEKVERVTRVVDEKELAEIKKRVDKWEDELEELEEMTYKIKSRPTSTSPSNAPVYVGSQGVEVGGHAIFSSLGVSGSTSTKTLGVGGEASFGSNSGDSFTVRSSSSFSAPVVVSSTLTVSGDMDTSGVFTLTESGGGVWKMGDVAGRLDYDGDMTVQSGGSLTLASSNGGDIVMNADSGRISAATGSDFYTSGGHPIRKAGEEILVASVPIYRYDIPSQTGSESYVRVSKYIENISELALPSAMEGTERVYKLVIKYSDDIDSGEVSNWRVWRPVAGEEADSFEVDGREAADLSEGQAYLTSEIEISDSDWQVEVKVPAGKTIRIHEIYLIAYDEIQ